VCGVCQDEPIGASPETSAGVETRLVRRVIGEFRVLTDRGGGTGEGKEKASGMMLGAFTIGKRISIYRDRCWCIY
jgi:hypothetical protein